VAEPTSAQAELVGAFFANGDFKGGTTEAAVKIFEKRGLKKILKEGVRAALRRSHELERSSG